MSVDAAVEIGWDLLKWAVTAIKRPIRYAMSSKSFADGLQEEVQNLEGEVQRVNILAEQARNNVREFLDVFTTWEKNSDDALKEVRELLGNFENATKTCCYGTLPDPKCRYQFSRKAEGKIEVIKRLAEKCGEFRELNDISFSDPAPGSVTASMIFESRAQIIRGIKDALADNSNSEVGVYGMGGLGKSTLLKEVKRIISEEKSFDWVAKADVSKNPDIKMIQGEIADALSLSEIKDKESISGRADLLRRRLETEKSNKKKVLIILDDLWERLDLYEVGIPCGHDNKVLGCKLLLASRDRDVLRREMDCDKDFRLSGLKEEEAKKLFERTVGDKVHDDEFKPLVNVALDKCAGVPFLIDALAKRFKDANLSEWKDTLKKIEKFKDKNISDLIHHMLLWSYEKLEEEVKSLLRLCVAYGISKPSLENLVRYSIGLGLFQEISSMEEARHRLNSHIRALQASSLLLDSENVDGFKVHDLVRDFIVAVSSRDHPLLVLKDEVKSVIELLKGKPSNYMAICFPYVEMEELPQEIDCPELCIFLLFTNKESLHVPDSLFNSMRKLKVLNLTGVHLTPLPLPFQLLENLHTLCLDGCLLEDVAILGKLKGLEILSFVNSKIQRLPEEIGQLVKLRLLDLNNCSKLQIIEPGVLRNLINLEELCMENSFNQWNAGELPTPLTNASLVELNNMKKLCTLYVFIPDSRMLPKDLNVEKLTKYKIQIGHGWRWSNIKGSKTLELTLNGISDILQKECIQSIFGEVDDLFLDGLDGIEQSICALSKKGFPKLKHLHIRNSPSIHYIHQLSSHTDFKRLESLILEDLIHLEKLCHNNIYSKSFSALKVVHVKRCHKMEVLFPLSSLRELPWLEEIKVIDCKSMKGIVEADDCGNVELRNLHVLELYDLPNVKNFFNAGSTPSSNTSDDQVGTQNAFFSGQQVTFSRLETLEIDGLDKVEFLFFPSMIKSLAQLRDLDICNCKKMEAIIVDEEALGLETSETLEFPMLTALNLTNLESLMCFSRGKRLREARSQDHIKSCSTSREVSFPSLKSFTMTALPNMKEIWSNESPWELSNLQTLEVAQCKSLLKVISSRLPVKVHKLHNLCIRDCNSVQEIFDLNEPSTNGNVDTLFEVTTLKLVKLGSLRCIWNKNPCGIMGFHNLNKLEVDHCDDLGFLFFPSMIKSLTQLRDLMVRRCKKMEAIIMEEEVLGSGALETLEFPTLTNLTLTYLGSLKCFSREKCSQEARSQDCIISPSAALFNQEVAFQRLEKLKITGLDNLEFLFSPSMVKSFTQLKELTVSSCEKMAAIVMEEEALEMETSEILAFPMLTNLHLEQLKSLTCFSHGKCAQESQSQDHVRSCATALFDRKVAFPRLETLFINGMDSIETIWDNQVAANSFPKLNELNVPCCDGLSSMISPKIAGNLVVLTKLSVSNCRMLTKVISDEGSEERHVVAFSHLKCMELRGLRRLRCFSSSGYTLTFPLLEDFTVSGCPNVKFFSEGQIEASKLKSVKVSTKAWFWKENLNITIQNLFEEMGVEFMQLSEFPKLIGKWHSELNPIKSSWQLESLVVDKCSSFVNAIPFKLMLVLENLRTLQVRDCESLEEIFDVEGLETMESTRVLSFFMTLHLVNLPKLKRLWNKDLQGTLSFSSLRSLILYKCSNLRHTFTLSMAGCLANLSCMEIKECGQMEGVIVEEEGQGSATEKITLSKLEELKLECLPNLTAFLLGKNHSMECLNLERLTIDRCPRMKSLVRESLMEINHSAPSLFTPQVQFPQLESMFLSRMDNLCKIWSDKPLETLKFEYLRELEARSCKSLENLFPHWVATSLTQLEELKVESCVIKEIVAIGDDTPHSDTTQVLFPQLSSLVLHDMPRLKSFCPNLRTLNWPLLKDLRVTHCDKVNMLSFAALMNNRTQRNDQQELSNQEAHSLLEKDFPMLERLSLVDKHIPMIQDGKFPKDIFDKAKALTLACFHDEKAAFPPIFLQEKFQNLQSLEILCSSFEEIFSDEGLVDERKHPVLKNLRGLKLNKLHNLKRMWREDSLVLKILQGIETLVVWDCPCLTTIFPTMTSFQNLTYLEVKNSSGLVHLVTTSVVTNLVHLIDMTIIGCERMKEVVANDENEEGKVISFENLRWLTLQNLPSLECFSSATSCSFRFPSLWTIEVEECPKMKIFTKGVLSTPKLNDVTLFRYNWEKENWREMGDDLNTTIQKLSA